ncbi:MAG: hypothetical protein ACYC8T_07435 [Myxococcaceae bacterium]
MRAGHHIALAVSLSLGIELLPLLCSFVASNFIKINSHSKESECKANLKGWYTAERAFQQEQGTFSPLIHPIGFEPERGNRYAYFASSTGSIEARSGGGVSGAQANTGVSVDTFKYGRLKEVSREQVLDLRRAGCITDDLTSGCDDITAVCAGNIDDDPALDIWSISTRLRLAPDGTGIPAGLPYNEISDRAVK